MSLDVSLGLTIDVGGPEKEYVEFYTRNITHNLGKMADKAGIYEACWRPEEIDCKYAYQLIPLLESGLGKLKSDPLYYKKIRFAKRLGDI